MHLPLTLAVSIPHRYDPNLKKPKKHSRVCLVVSIPHRYDPNTAFVAPVDNGLILFQFLIGTIQTQIDALITIEDFQFQFLIGTIQTEICQLSQNAPVSFQFLIGTIQTCCLTIRPPTTRASVSIPHRYDPNLRYPGRTKHRSWTFQFLIGTIQTKSPARCWSGGWRVSIPHRYDPN